MNNPEFRGYRIICQELGWVDKLFVSFAQERNLYNTGIRVSNHRVTRFEIDGMIIEENTQYSSVQATIDTLNDGIQSDKDKFFYHEQSLHSLAIEYYRKSFDDDIFSFLSPELMAVLASCKNAPQT